MKVKENLYARVVCKSPSFNFIRTNNKWFSWVKVLHLYGFSVLLFLLHNWTNKCLVDQYKNSINFHYLWYQLNLLLSRLEYLSTQSFQSKGCSLYLDFYLLWKDLLLSSRFKNFRGNFIICVKTSSLPFCKLFKLIKWIFFFLSCIFLKRKNGWHIVWMIGIFWTFTWKYTKIYIYIYIFSDS